jgi:hypothetical protein
MTAPAQTLPKLVVDSASLITAAKFTVDSLTVVEYIAQRCQPNFSFRKKSLIKRNKRNSFGHNASSV